MEPTLNTIALAQKEFRIKLPSHSTYDREQSVYPLDISMSITKLLSKAMHQEDCTTYVHGIPIEKEFELVRHQEKKEEQEKGPLETAHPCSAQTWSGMLLPTIVS